MFILTFNYKLKSGGSLPRLPPLTSFSALLIIETFYSSPGPPGPPWPPWPPEPPRHTGPLEPPGPPGAPVQGRLVVVGRGGHWLRWSFDIELNQWTPLMLLKRISNIRFIQSVLREICRELLSIYQAWQKYCFLCQDKKSSS